MFRKEHYGFCLVRKKTLNIKNAKHEIVLVFDYTKVKDFLTRECQRSEYMSSAGTYL